MGEPFLGEIKIVGFNFPPKGWAFCNGQSLPINQNQALFSLLGTMYGGNGVTTFALPDLRDRVPLHRSGSIDQGQVGGSIGVTLVAQQLPEHGHTVMASTSVADTPVGVGGVLADTGSAPVYASAGALTILDPSSVTTIGGSQPHANVQPSLVLNFCVAIVGIFPSRN